MTQPMTALERGRAMLARTSGVRPVNLRSWHYDAGEIEAFCDWLDKAQPMGGDDGDLTSNGVRRVLVRLEPHKWNEEHDAFVRAEMSRRGLDVSGREDAYDDWNEIVGRP